MNLIQVLITAAVLACGSAIAVAQESSSAQVNKPAESLLAQPNKPMESPWAKTNKLADCDPPLAQVYRPNECEPPLAQGQVNE
jgi:hypothetical protein